ncbi:hypothetical protein TetV_563 [Tetraselmis virus 1]|uniref:Minor capsid protein P8 central region domain-containing protein n=1 Tax=Tetraselmis virus 1 TaxID=2060617 RepID=A0A2P0VP19_9VIRU|nr:hypothetical protein QJ968_gp491 [Tetraselmis virus 1]AUF82645.1 hypothetical protein TetV_563 [Tetraselmis virus 1]
MLFETPTVGGVAAGHTVAPPRLEKTPVSAVFFHPRNIQCLHNSIRYRVYKKTGKVIDRQGDQQLYVLMSSVYQDSQDPTLESGLSGSVDDIIRKLNERVLYKAVNEILNAMQYYQFYMNDISTPVPTPLPRSEFADQRTGLKTLELPIGFGFDK